MKCFLALFISILFLYPGYGKAQDETKIDSSKVRKIRIDPQTAKGLSAAKLFEEVKFIPLETTKESLFGNISKMEVLQDRFVIYDIDTRSVFIFSKDGHYINKITNKDVSKINKNSIIVTFQIAKVDTSTFIDIQSRDIIYRFNKAGVFQKSIKPDLFYNALKINNTSIIQNFSTDNKNIYEFAISKGGEIKKYFPFTYKRYEENDYISLGPRFYANSEGDKFLFHLYYSPDLFEITEDGVSLKYQIILPTDISLPSGFLTDPQYKFKQQSYLAANKNTVYGLSGCYTFGNYLFINLTRWTQQHNIKKNLVYNLKTNELISIQDIGPDETSHFLPINDSTIGGSFLNLGFLCADKEKLYTSMSAVSIAKFGDMNRQHANDFPPALTAYLKNNEEFKNPVVIALKPLKN